MCRFRRANDEFFQCRMEGSDVDGGKYEVCVVSTVSWAGKDCEELRCRCDAIPPDHAAAVDVACPPACSPGWWAVLGRSCANIVASRPATSRWSLGFLPSQLTDAPVGLTSLALPPTLLYKYKYPAY